MQAIGISATSSAAVVSVFQYPYYTSSVSGSGTETVTFSNTDRGNAYATIGGTPTTGDVVSVIGHSAALSGGSQTASYTVVAGDTLLSISQGVSAAIDANTALKTLGVSAGSAATLAWSQSFSGKTPLPAGANLSAVSAIDGNSNTKTNDYQVGINGGSASTLTFDANGNMTSDGTNTYQWDAENRLIQINYPGTGNYSLFGYDGINQNIGIVEYSGGVLSSTKQFVWADAERIEQRTTTGSISAQFFKLGETVSGTNYFFTTDHIGFYGASVKPFLSLAMLVGGPPRFNPLASSGSVREMTNSTGVVQAQISYDPYGTPTRLGGSLTPDFQYAGYYFHAQSGLNPTVRRFYNSREARWLNRDPINELGGLNLYTYVSNNPLKSADPSGLQQSMPSGDQCCLKTFGVTNGGGMGQTHDFQWGNSTPIITTTCTPKMIPPEGLRAHQDTYDWPSTPPTTPSGLYTIE